MSKGSSATPSKRPTPSKSTSQAAKSPAKAQKAQAGASGKSKRKNEASGASARPGAAPAPAPTASSAAPAAPAAAAAGGPPGGAPGPQQLVRPELAALALETSSRVKRQRVLSVIIPQSTSARMAEAARASVWAISSEKTTQQFEAAEAAADAKELRRTDGLVNESTPALDETLRRSSRDLFAFMREELDRDEDDPKDPHSLWRSAHKRLRHELSSAPAPGELKRLEGRLGAQLPPSFWDFSMEWGGGLMFVHEFGAIRILPALDIVSELKGPLCGRMLRPYLPIVDLGCGDYLALDMGKESKGGERPIVWWYGGEAKKKVADSFVAWLKKLVELNGQPYWWD